MIRNEKEYIEAMRRIKEDQCVIEQQRAALESRGYAPQDVEYGMGPLLSFHAQLVEEVEWYERVRRRDIQPISDLTALGQLLIAARIALGLSQAELASRLGVSEAQVSRDERNEYRGISTDRAQRIFDAMGIRTVTRVEWNQILTDAKDLVTA
ncbi:MAG: transcriptional regulator [Chloroflexi bacterium]|nr:transcriptional regulator [Chloroflexota bacterium]